MFVIPNKFGSSGKAGYMSTLLTNILLMPIRVYGT